MILEQIRKKIKFLGWGIDNPFLPLFIAVILIFCNVVLLSFIALLPKKEEIIFLKKHNSFTFSEINKKLIKNTEGDLNQIFSDQTKKINQPTNFEVLASKNGKKYYFPSCSGVNRIKVENRIYFLSVLEAEKAGFSLASNCKKP